VHVAITNHREKIVARVGPAVEAAEDRRIPDLAWSTEVPDEKAGIEIQAAPAAAFPDLVNARRPDSDYVDE